MSEKMTKQKHNNDVKKTDTTQLKSNQIRNPIKYSDTVQYHPEESDTASITFQTQDGQTCDQRREGDVAVRDSDAQDSEGESGQGDSEDGDGVDRHGDG